MLVKFKIFFFLFLPAITFAKGDQKSVRQLVKSTAANSGTSFKVVNKYGKITVNLWDKNEIQAKVTITGFGKNENEAKTIADFVDIEDSKNGDEFVLTTKYNPGSGKNWFFGGGKRDGKEYVNIDYEVYIPRKLKNITLDNSFGDVLAYSLTSPTLIRVNYGFFDVSDADDLYLQVNYCDKGKIGKAGKVEIKGNYSSFRIEEVKQLTMTTNNCDYRIGKVDALNIRANYDDFRLESAGSLTAVCNYTDLNIGRLEQQGTFSVNYSDIKIKSTGDLKSFNFNGTYSDVTVWVSQKLPVKIDAVLSYGDVSTGGLAMKNVNTVRKSSSLVYSGTNGSGQVPFQVKGAYCDFSLKTND